MSTEHYPLKKFRLCTACHGNHFFSFSWSASIQAPFALNLLYFLSLLQFLFGNCSQRSIQHFPFLAPSPLNAEAMFSILLFISCLRFTVDRSVTFLPILLRPGFVCGHVLNGIQQTPSPRWGTPKSTSNMPHGLSSHIIEIILQSFSWYQNFGFTLWRTSNPVQFCHSDLQFCSLTNFWLTSKSLYTGCLCIRQSADSRSNLFQERSLYAFKKSWAISK